MHRNLRFICKLALLAYVSAFSVNSAAQAGLSLAQLIALAVNENPIMQVTAAQKTAAIANVQTARAYLNPELELNAGPANYRANTPQARHGTYNLTLSQPLEFSDVRTARRTLAEQGIEVMDRNIGAVRFDLTNQVKVAYMQVLQKQQIAELMQANLGILKEVQSKVKRRVDTGEAAKYELIKADTELLAADRDVQIAMTEVSAAKASLRGLIGQGVPRDFGIQDAIPAQAELPSLEELLAMVPENPTLQQLRAVEASANAKVTLEQKLRFSGLTLKSGIEQDPDLNIFRVGVVVPLPLWNKREGQIAEAMANVTQAKANIDYQTLAFSRELETAYQRVQIAKNQMAIYESGLLTQAEAALVRAESAYKYGERGILEYLDAQRTYRAVNRDYVLAKFDYFQSVLLIEKLVGKELFLTATRG